MDTSQINRILRSDAATKGCFLGTFPLDRLPQPHSFPASAVANLDDSTMPGSHWVALFRTNYSKGEYFDSFGRRPPEAVISSFLSGCTDLQFNIRPAQSKDTITCGQWSILFILLRSRGLSLNNIRDCFDKGFHHDKAVNAIVQSYSKDKLRVYDNFSIL